MNVQALKVKVKEVRDYNSSPTGDYDAEAAVADNGELLITLRPVKHSMGDEVYDSEHSFIALRFNRWETTKIRSALNKGGQ